VEGWSHSTREKVSGNALTTLRDFGLLHGKAAKEIIEPIVPPVVVQHLIGVPTFFPPKIPAKLG
jgi:Putative inner membrane protein (DUF1819)